MNTYHLTIASPDGNAFEGEAISLIVRGVEGDLAIMADHAPFITALVPCHVKLLIPGEEGESERHGIARGGLLSVSQNKVVLLSASFHWE
ncbi:MAG: hypothetical protein IJM90_02930 [Firmicutes bacterium]|nr:hypothetical protein [Bacillota bacterium]